MTLASTPDTRTFSEIERLCRTESGPELFAPRVAERLRRAVPFDGYAVVTLDPLSGLATDFHFSDEMGSEDDARFFLEHIYFEDDVLDYGWMARNRIAAMTLSEATGGKLERALRYREYNAPKGFGPGVRAVLSAHGRPWGGLCLVRGKDVEDFSEREVEFLRRISPHLGAGLRAGTLRFEARRDGANGDAGFAFDSPASQAVGVLNLDDAGRVTRRTASAEHLLRELGAPETGRGDEQRLPMAVWAVAGALRSKRSNEPSDIPCLRVPARSGGWLTLQASLTEPADDGSVETVVVIAPAGPAEMVQLNTTAYGLSAREKEVVDLIVRGFSTRQISRTLFISESTVQGHLSHVFEKVGVKSRRELLKRLFLDNLAQQTPA